MCTCPWLFGGTLNVVRIVAESVLHVRCCCLIATKVNNILCFLSADVEFGLLLPADGRIAGKRSNLFGAEIPLGGRNLKITWGAKQLLQHSDNNQTWGVGVSLCVGHPANDGFPLGFPLVEFQSLQTPSPSPGPGPGAHEASERYEVHGSGPNALHRLCVPCVCCLSFVVLGLLSLHREIGIPGALNGGTYDWRLNFTPDLVWKKKVEWGISSLKFGICVFVEMCFLFETLAWKSNSNLVSYPGVERGLAVPAAFCQGAAEDSLSVSAPGRKRWPQRCERVR